jgi:hypothetical protein
MSTSSKILAGIALVAVVIGFYTWRSEKNAVPVVLSAKETQELRTEVIQSINYTAGDAWDKQMTIDEINNAGTAVKGTWSAKDQWDWIAWKEGNEGWTVLVSLDGFNCANLDTMPEKFKDFFADVTMTPSGEKYCYDHSTRQ